tara:strand:- start:773 stop:2005 length:1233 start_codon:yes stop_codon:yes gene_type:complete
MIRIINCSIYLFFIFISIAHSHYFSESYSKWVVDEEYIEGTFNVLELESTRVLQLPQLQKYLYEDDLTESEVFLKYLNDNIKVLSNQNVCQKTKPFTILASEQGSLNITMNFQCKSGDAIKIINNAFFDIVQSHVHIARVYQNDQIITEKALFYNDQTINLSHYKDDELKNSFFKNFLSFVDTGIQHILNGFDHLLFIAGLILLTIGFRNLLLIITGFTIGHSITLALSFLGFVIPNMMIIESLIGFTILFIGIEYHLIKTGNYKTINIFLILLLFSIYCLSFYIPLLISYYGLLGLLLFSFGYFSLHKNLKDKNILLLLITVLFGLIHGYGFGSFLIKSQISSENLLSALFGFNIGVEIGQIIFVIIILVIFKIIRYFKLDIILESLKNIIFIFIVSLGFFWFIERLII